MTDITLETKAGRLKSIFDYVAKHKEFLFDHREIIDKLNISFENKIVLDAGCGQGACACYIASEMKAKKVIGFDLSNESIKRAKELKKSCKLDNIHFVTNNIEGFNTEEKFDIVLAIGVLPYADNLFLSINRLYCLLKGIEESRESYLIFTMTEPSLINRFALVAQMVFSKTPDKYIPNAVKFISLFYRPFGFMLKKRRRLIRSTINGKERSVENFLRESIFASYFNIIKPETIIDYFVKRKYEATVTVKTLPNVNGMYAVIVRKSRTIP